MERIWQMTLRKMAAAGMAALTLAVDADSLETRMKRVETVKDEIVTSLKVTFHTKADPEGKDSLAMWRAEAKENVKLKDAFVRVDFALSPEKGSDIKCRAELPLPEKWDGRLWGQGNSGRAGSLPSLKGYVADGTAGVTTDLGTSSVVVKGAPATDNVWPAAVLRDFHWRATHLMTLTTSACAHATAASRRRKRTSGSSAFRDVRTAAARAARKRVRRSAVPAGGAFWSPGAKKDNHPRRSMSAGDKRNSTCRLRPIPGFMRRMRPASGRFGR